MASSRNGDAMARYGKLSNEPARLIPLREGWWNPFVRQRAAPMLVKCVCSTPQQRSNSNQMSIMPLLSQDDGQNRLADYHALESCRSLAMWTLLWTCAVCLLCIPFTRHSIPIQDRSSTSIPSFPLRNQTDSQIFSFHSINTGHLPLKSPTRTSSEKEGPRHPWI